VLIAGVDGYLGWTLAQYLTAAGHDVAGCDAYFRRAWVDELGGTSALPISDMDVRLGAFRETYGTEIEFREGDLRDYEFVEDFVRNFRPDAIVHLGEMPSAPYSMIDVKHAVFTQTNNIVSTMNILFTLREFVPDAHLLKLGTMGEYGTPNVAIPEGFFEIEYRGRKDRMPFPRQAGSWYHWSKVHGSNNIMFACRMWGIRATDVMQGVVYGTRFDNQPNDARLLTRLDFDQAFGTAINRFCCQAVIGHPLTPFGKGHQKRGFIPLRDSVQCMKIALENPPDAGEYRVLNQFEEVYDITDLAQKVQATAAELGLNATIQNLENPRIEMEDHYYQPDHKILRDLGYKPTHDMGTELRVMLEHLIEYRERIESARAALIPDVHWDGHRAKVSSL
jgi:UDP-sulfoquinovose synthase